MSPGPPPVLPALPPHARTRTHPIRPPLLLQGLAGEFEAPRALVVGCSRIADTDDVGVIVEIVKAAAEATEVIVLATDDAAMRKVARLLGEARVPAEAVRILPVEHDSPWVRDYGPLCVFRRDLGPAFIDALYSQADDSRQDVRHRDDRVPIELGRHLGLPVIRVPIDVEGGNLLSNGQGVAVMTTAMLGRNAEMGFDPQLVMRILSDTLGFEQVVVLDRLEGEATGHVDLYASFTAPDAVVVAEIDPAEDPVNAAVLEKAARLLATVQTRIGPLRVHRVPMPLRREGKWRSYTNVVYLGGVLLLPSYRDVDPALEAEAAAVYRRLLPGWRIVPIDCSGPIEQAGALRCLTLNLPGFVDLMPVQPLHRLP